MENLPCIYIKNHSAPVPLAQIPVSSYDVFTATLHSLLSDTANHCALYFAVPMPQKLSFYCVVACDATGLLALFAHETAKDIKALPSVTPELPAMHIFEREIFEQHGVSFEGHPWLKPVRFPKAGSLSMNEYPFFGYDSEQLHEVGVGPVHAGIIEPGHFRFVCHGENVLHLEIHLGYQHRGVEQLMVKFAKPFQRMLLSENIAGDSTIAHAWTHAALMESLSGNNVPEALQLQRCIGLELERIAVHIGDTSALCTDVAYQLGQVVNEALRTTIINTTQLWCGNRFGKGLIRVGGSHYPMSSNVKDEMLNVLADSGKRYIDMAERIFSLPSVLSRFDGIGTVTLQQATGIGAVGMAARTSGLSRDIRASHPFGAYTQAAYSPVIETTGDVLARAHLRFLEVKESLNLIKTWAEFPSFDTSSIPAPVNTLTLMPDALAIALTEGWRGEICHAAVTGTDGSLVHYKVKDPSMHNWFCLALAVRNQEISDFPVCNKSFNLSYCGNDL